MTNPTEKKEAKFYVAHTKKFQSAIDSTGTSKSQIATSGKLSLETLNKALKGGKVSRVKANGIINGLSEHGYKCVLSEIFHEWQEEATQ